MTGSVADRHLTQAQLSILGEGIDLRGLPLPLERLKARVCKDFLGKCHGFRRKWQSYADTETTPLDNQDELSVLRPLAAEQAA